MNAVGFTRQSDKYTHYRPPCPAPEYVVERLARFQPEVKLVWNYGRERWQLIERLMDGTWDHIILLEKDEAPTLENTCQFLDSCDKFLHMDNEYDTERFIDSLQDAPQRLEELHAQRRATQAAEETADRLMHISRGLRGYSLDPRRQDD